MRHSQYPDGTAVYFCSGIIWAVEDELYFVLYVWAKEIPRLLCFKSCVDLQLSTICQITLGSVMDLFPHHSHTSIEEKSCKSYANGGGTRKVKWVFYNFE